MWNRNAQYHEWLLPYLEGGLDEARRARLEARLGEDPALAAEAERLRRTLNGLRGAAARTPRPESAQAPADLWPHLRARLVLHPAPPPRASRAWWLAGVGAPAAAALIVAAFWLPGWHTPAMPQFSTRPPLRPQAAPSFATPSAAPRPPAMGGGFPTGKPKPAVPEPPRPAPAATRATPFDLRAAAPPVNHTANGSLTPPPAPAPQNRLAVRPSRPPLPAVSIAPLRRQSGAGADSPAAPPVLPAPALLPAPAPPMTAAPKPLPPVPPPAPSAALNGQHGNRPAASDEAAATAGLGGGAGFGGGAAAPAAGASLKETVDGLGGSVRQQARSSPKALNLPPMFGPAGRPFPGVRRNKTALRPAPPGAPGSALQAFAADAQAGLDSWQAALSAAVRPPLWGENAGEQQANQALMAARESGGLDDLRARLEARRAQSPRELVVGRMLAAVYDFGFSKEAALRERRRVVGLEGAGGEDWFVLAQAEERVGNGPAARAAYRRALESPVPPSSFHAAIARQKG